MHITEDYVSFETAKLLKEKGFDEPCLSYFWSEGIDTSYTDIPFTQNNMYEGQILRPTFQMAMKWLREKHNQNITVKAHNNVARLKTVYYAEVQNLLEPAEKGFCVNGCTFKDTHEEACESAIKYCLENLI